jgi:hypothetical protein
LVKEEKGTQAEGIQGSSPKSKSKGCLIVIVLTILVLFVFVFPFNTYHYNDYGTIENTETWGKVGSRLLGNFTDKGLSTIYGTPYKLIVWIDFHDSKTTGTVTITSVELKDMESGKVSFHSDEQLPQTITDGLPGAGTHFSFEYMQLKYVPYQISVKYLVKTEERTFESELKEEFTKQYRKEHHNNFIMGCMSV